MTIHHIYYHIHFIVDIRRITICFFDRIFMGLSIAVCQLFILSGVNGLRFGNRLVLGIFGSECYGL